MEKLSREQILDLLARAEAELLRIGISQQPQLLKKPLSLLLKAYNAYSDELPKQVYESKCQQFLLPLSQAMEQTIEQDNRKDLKEITELAASILNQLYENLKNAPSLSRLARKKKEIVFLPYKAAMWDSLESIWRAAAADTEHCHTYVVPIPYADRNPDGTAKEWHCEKDLFPNDVPTMDWKSVNLEAMHPDIIFIHNPFDNYNIITSVDSNYYSGKLHSLTKMLVYVPYFLAGGRWPEAHIFEAAYHNFDKIIVQHDKIKIQRKVFSVLQESRDKFLSDYIPQAKLVPLGSPKLDRLFYCEAHIRYPDGWRDFIDGRKVVFYNTSISGLLTHRGNFIKKMRYIFDVFSNRKDVVLLWRPHPLLDITISTMVPYLNEEYQNLKNEFISRNLGLFDENPNIEMSIAISDAYIGEGSSSVVQLFGFTGKPIFFTEEMLLWQKPTKEEQSSIRCVFMHLYEEKLYFIAEGHNVFCSLDRKSGEVQPICQFKDYSFNDWLYSSFIFVDGKVYLVPANAKSICIYDLLNGDKKNIPLESSMEWGNFIAAVSYKKYIYFIPFRYSAILRYDTETGEICYFSECVEAIRPNHEDIHDELLCGGVVRCEKMLIPVRHSNQVLEFDMEDESYRVFEVGPDDADCIGIVAESENVYWLIPWRTAKIRRWNYVTGECEVIDRYPSGYNCEADWFNGVDYIPFAVFCPQKGGVWLFPAYGNMILRLDYGTRQLEKVELNLPYELRHRKSNYYHQQVEFFSVAYINPQELVLLSSFDRSLYFVNTQTLTWERQELRFSDKMMANISSPMAESFCQIGEDVMYASRENAACRNVEQYIDYVLSGVHDSKRQKEAYSAIAVNADGTCGEKVYNYIMEALKENVSRG